MLLCGNRQCGFPAKAAHWHTPPPERLCFDGQARLPKGYLEDNPVLEKLLAYTVWENVDFVFIEEDLSEIRYGHLRVNNISDNSILTALDCLKSWSKLCILISWLVSLMLPASADWLSNCYISALFYRIHLPFAENMKVFLPDPSAFVAATHEFPTTTAATPATETPVNVEAKEGWR
ncbi:hypothetical protein J0S82_015400, partial [Galemys pyrenaicus]